jgi:hypothetical protein
MGALEERRARPALSPRVAQPTFTLSPNDTPHTHCHHYYVYPVVNFLKESMNVVSPDYALLLCNAPNNSIEADAVRPR